MAKEPKAKTKKRNVKSSPERRCTKKPAKKKATRGAIKTCGDLGGKTAQGKPCSRKAQGKRCMSHGGKKPAGEGRKKKDITEKQVLALASINCSYEEMALILGCTEKTLSNRFYQVIQKGRAQMKSSLKRKQYTVAIGGNTTMLIWLGKNNLDQKDKQDVEHHGPGDGPIPHKMVVEFVGMDDVEKGEEPGD